MSEQQEKRCAVCRRSSQELPMITLEYQGAQLWICPHHMPNLIHDPATLIGKLPGAEKIEPSNH